MPFLKFFPSCHVLGFCIAVVVLTLPWSQLASAQFVDPVRGVLTFAPTLEPYLQSIARVDVIGNGTGGRTGRM